MYTSRMYPVAITPTAAATFILAQQHIQLKHFLCIKIEHVSQREKCPSPSATV